MRKSKFYIERKKRFQKKKNNEGEYKNKQIQEREI